MPQFYVEKIEEKEEIFNISNENILKHLFVMRVKVGENVKFISKDKIKYEAKVLNISKKVGKFKIIDKYLSKNELQQNICVAQVILKNAENEAVSNATQIGAKTIQPLYSDFCTVKKTVVKIEKLQKIAFETFKQCERADIPEINEVKDLKNYLHNKKNVVIFGEKCQNSKLKDCIKTLDKKSEITVVIGPEGGFSNNEFEFFEKENFPIVSLGTTILKAENAIIAGVSNLVYELER